jgi:transposase-like protein
MGGDMLRNEQSIACGEVVPTSFRVEEDKLAFLTDANQALKLLRQCRWSGGKFCPKCKSRNVMQTNSFVYRELFRCSLCRYSFNVTSLTIFHGSKLALNKHFQLLVAIDIGRKYLSAREIGAFVDVSERTVKLHLEKYPAGPCDTGFARLLDVSGGKVRPNSLVATLMNFDARITESQFMLRLRQWLTA